MFGLYSGVPYCQVRFSRGDDVAKHELVFIRDEDPADELAARRGRRIPRPE
jgi:hypothetical protein